MVVIETGCEEFKSGCQVTLEACCLRAGMCNIVSIGIMMIVECLC